MQAQFENVKPFNKRVGTPQPPNGVFNVRGDFSLIGNTNLRLNPYFDNVDNSNSSMQYVDVDNVASTVNSSSATLVFSQEEGADPNCSEIIYAGLYWSGRATPSIGNTFEVTTGVPSGTQSIADNASQLLTHNSSVNFSNYQFTIQQSINGSFPRYVLSPSALSDGNTVQFEWTNQTSNQIRYRFGTSGLWTTATGISISNFSSNNSVATFDPITFTTDNVVYIINRLTRDTRTDRTDFQTSSRYSMTISANGTFIPLIANTITVDKRKVKLKGPSANS